MQHRFSIAMHKNLGTKHEIPEMNECVSKSNWHMAKPHSKIKPLTKQESKNDHNNNNDIKE